MIGSTKEELHAAFLLDHVLYTWNNTKSPWFLVYWKLGFFSLSFFVRYNIHSASVGTTKSQIKHKHWRESKPLSIFWWKAFTKRKYVCCGGGKRAPFYFSFRFPSRLWDHYQQSLLQQNCSLMLWLFFFLNRLQVESTFTLLQTQEYCRFYQRSEQTFKLAQNL